MPLRLVKLADAYREQLFDIRHYLNDSLPKCGGHIGDGVRPSERRKGIVEQRF